MIDGNAIRDTKFYVDKSVPSKYRSYSSHYSNSGYDRGHLSPAADWQYSQAAMTESFYLSNICPLDPVLNRKYWNLLELFERYLTYMCDSLYIITGTIRQDNKYIKNKIRIPTALYKTIIRITNHQVIYSCAWIYQNNDSVQYISGCEYTIDEVENIINKDLYKDIWFNELVESKKLRFNK